MTGGNGDHDISLDELFTLLSSSRRRHVVELLDEQGGEAAFRELTDAVARRETGEPVSYDERKRVYVSLRQSHLPRLAEAGVVDYDRDRGTVRATPLFETVLRPLKAVRKGHEALADADADD